MKKSIPKSKIMSHYEIECVCIRFQSITDGSQSFLFVVVSFREKKRIFFQHFHHFNYEIQETQNSFKISNIPTQTPLKYIKCSNFKIVSFNFSDKKRKQENKQQVQIIRLLNPEILRSLH